MRKIPIFISCLVAAALHPDVVRADMTHRWSFNSAPGPAGSGTIIVDSLGGANAVVKGNGASLTGTNLVLPGTTTGAFADAQISAYVDLPNGIISANTDLTLEIWATPLSSKIWQCLFDFGRTAQAGDGGGAPGEYTGGATPPGTSASDGIMLSLQWESNLNMQRLEAVLDGGPPSFLDTALSTTAGEPHHYVLTFASGVGVFPSGGQITWYRDAAVVGSLDVPFALSQIEDVNNWLGRTQWSADSMSNVAYDEVRMYDHAFTASEVTQSFASGPETNFVPPSTSDDSVVMHHGQKARIAVLQNDTGSLSKSTVMIQTPPSSGSVTVESSGFVLYANTIEPTAGIDSFTYTVAGPGGRSQPATVRITFSNSLRISNPALAMPTSPPETFWQMVDALPNVTFNQPICLASIPGDSRRLFVCERIAQIQLIPDVTAAQPTKQLFLDLEQVVAGRNPTETIEGGLYDEHGLLGLAFHPSYATNGSFYVAYTVRIAGGAFYQRVSRFKVSTGNPNLADPTSELVLIQQLDEGADHDGGDLHFGPDGYLYYAAGDEDVPADWRKNSQKIDKDFFSGIFRIDVDKRPGNRAPNAHSAIPRDNGQARFSVPADNPFIHTSLGGTWDGKLNGITVPNLNKVRTEFWALGFRHPWRFSFDSATGDLWVGEVGEDTYEEIDLVQKGGNYGWVYREGFHDTNFTDPAPPAKPPGFTSIDPVYEYLHSQIPGGDAQFKGNAIYGGVVYRGSRFPELYSAYIFGDSVSGHIWRRNGTSGVVDRLTGVPGAYGGIVSMGSDPSNQDLLFADYVNGRILRLTRGDVTTTFPATLTQTGLFADLSDLSPNPGLLPYEPNLPFWSDYAIKRRWFAIPNDNGTMTWSRDQNWTSPSGMLWVKHFDLELERDNPATKRRIETRVLVKTATGAYGVSYRWNDAQTEATLAPDEGVDFDINVVENGMNRTQRWQIPGRASCLTCHTPQAGHALSFTTRQMNRSEVINGFAGNQLTLFKNAGYFDNTPDSPNILPRHIRANETAYPVETRVRSYLAVNCAYCHQQGGTGNGIWDGRAHLTLAQTQLINGAVENNGGNPANRLVVPGDTAHSVVYNRVAAANGFTRMPPLATSELDQADIALLQNWITTTLPTRQSFDQWRLSNFGSTTSPNGDPAADPDGDGHTNFAEFLGLTNPLNGGSFFVPTIAASFGDVSVSFQAPAHRWVFVETSTDLQTWSLWDMPGNSGSLSNGIITFTRPHLGSKQFFRLRLQEN